MLIVLAGVVPSGAALFGLDPVQTLLLAALGAGLGAVIAFRPVDAEPPDWPGALNIDVDQGARRDIARLSWSVSGSDRQVGRTLRLRLRQVAIRRLALRGIDLTDPAMAERAVEAIGPAAYSALDPDRREIVGLAAFAEAVRAVEALEPSR